MALSLGLTTQREPSEVNRCPPPDLQTQKLTPTSTTTEASEGLLGPLWHLSPASAPQAWGWEAHSQHMSQGRQAGCPKGLTQRGLSSCQHLPGWGAKSLGRELGQRKWEGLKRGASELVFRRSPEHPSQVYWRVGSYAWHPGRLESLKDKTKRARAWSKLPQHAPRTSLQHSWFSILRLCLFPQPSPWAQPEHFLPHQAGSLQS